MRPKLFALLAVPVLALVGCSTAEPAPTPAESPSASASSTEQVKTAEERIVGEHAYESGIGITPEEYGFTVYFNSQTHGFNGKGPKLKMPTEAQLVRDLHAYCDSGTPFDYSNHEGLNKKLAKIADAEGCATGGTED